MKRIMLVDDEILVRESIRACVDWEQEGFIYCGDASDGETALPLIDKYQPEILITDIKMPFMNGLELSKLVRQKYPDIKIIVLSGHDEFEYARSALRIGVEEYCLKPVSSKDIIRILNETGNKIDKEREEREQLAEMKQRELRSKLHSRDKMLNDLCSGLITTTEAIHTAAELDLDLMGLYYTVVITTIRKNCTSDSDDTLPIEEIESELQASLENHTNQVLSYKSLRADRVWIFKSDTLERLQDAITKFQSLVSEAEQRYASCSLHVGIGSVQMRLQGLHQSFIEAEEDKLLQLLSLQNRVAFNESASDKIDVNIYLDRNVFIDFLKKEMPAQTDAFLHEYCEAFRSIDWAQHKQYLSYILNDLTIEVFRTAKEYYKNMESWETTLPQVQEQIERVGSWEDAYAFLVKLAELFWSWRLDATNKHGDVIRQVKQYILTNFHNEDLSLRNAAAHVQLSPSHLSKLFSQETGQTFIEFLTQTRINKAIALLQTTNAKSYEIAYQVGYSDPHYFSNIFRKVTGMTTKSFRQQLIHHFAQSENGGSSDEENIDG